MIQRVIKENTCIIHFGTSFFLSPQHKVYNFLYVSWCVYTSWVTLFRTFSQQHRDTVIKHATLSPTYGITIFTIQVKPSNCIKWLCGIRRNHHHIVSSNSPNTNKKVVLLVFFNEIIGFKWFYLNSIGNEGAISRVS